MLIRSIAKTIEKKMPRTLEPGAVRLYFELKKRNWIPADWPSPLVPRGDVNFVGDGDFLKVGELFVQYFRDLCDLQPNERVLDLGCGIGRMAIPLTQYLTSGHYEGSDIVPSAIDWCQRRITPCFPNFRFTHFDVISALYNPTGIYLAEEYSFPYPDHHFDFVFLTSVFTHLVPEEVDHYLKEIHRVLRPGGRCFATFFIADETIVELAEQNKKALTFPQAMGSYWLHDRDVPAKAVAYRESFLRSLFKKHHLVPRKPIRYGRWSGRKEGFDYQDFVLLDKKSNWNA